MLFMVISQSSARKKNQRDGNPCTNRMLLSHALPNLFPNGEYERTTAVALNAYIGPTTVGYVNRLNHKLKELGYKKPLQISQCAGGTISVAKANDAPLLTLDSGPVSGVTGSVRLGTELDTANIITTDLGGTSFDVGVIHGLNPTVSYKSLVHQS